MPPLWLQESDFALHRLVECYTLETSLLNGTSPSGCVTMTFQQKESVLFIGTQFSNLYTAVDTPAVKCASVSRCACRKRRRKNSPCMRVLVLTWREEKKWRENALRVPVALDLAGMGL
jgi:hypothetical protein